MRPNWSGIAGWLLLLAGFIVALAVPYPHNGLALLAVVLGVLGGLLVALAVSRRTS